LKTNVKQKFRIENCVQRRLTLCQASELLQMTERPCEAACLKTAVSIARRTLQPVVPSQAPRPPAAPWRFDAGKMLCTQKIYAAQKGCPAQEMFLNFEKSGCILFLKILIFLFKFVPVESLSPSLQVGQDFVSRY
jgi:hypothetical protein